MNGNKIRDIFAEFQTDDKEYTHECTVDQKIKWNIKAENKEKFWIDYFKLLEQNSDDLCVAEKKAEYMPVIANLKLCFDIEEEMSWEPYNDSFLYYLVYAYQQALGAKFQVEDGGAEKIAVVLESDMTRQEDNGVSIDTVNVRIQFPYAKVSDDGQQLIRAEAIKNIRKLNIISKINKEPIGDWEKIISDKVGKEPLTMYGSLQKGGSDVLKIAHICGEVNPDDMMDENGDSFCTKQLEDVFYVEYHKDIMNGLVKVDTLESFELTDLLPMFLSVDYCQNILLKKTDSKKTPIATSTKKTAMEILKSKSYDEEQISEDMNSAEKFLMMISDDRIRTEGFWLEIGRALYTTSVGKKNGLDCWIRYSERASDGHAKNTLFMTKYGSVKNTCTDLYNTFRNNKITIRTLAWYAREDSPHYYASWHNDWISSSMAGALTCTHSDVAKCLYRCNWLEFAYYSKESDGWYQFSNHRWIRTHQCISLKKIISSSFLHRFEVLRASLAIEIAESNDNGMKDSAETSNKKINVLINNLKNTSFKESITRECKEHFCNDNLVPWLDSDLCTTGVVNGVLEVIGVHVIFRNGKPEDYISMCAGTSYQTEYTWDNPLVIKAMKWLSQIFVDEELIIHNYKFMSSFLMGGNKDKLFPMLSGDGDNSKSMFVKQLELVLGPYSIKIPVNIFTDKSNRSSGPTPEMARAKNARAAFVDEPEDDVPMNKGIIKRYTGGDSFFARLCNKDGGDIVATFILILICNKPPVIPKADRATKNRTRIFPYLSNWVTDAPETEEEQFKRRKFKMDKNFDKQLPIMAPAFLWLMVQYFPQYATEGLEDPKVVTEYTQNYWKDNDIYAQFSNDVIKITDPQYTKVSLGEVYTAFKSWFKEAFPGLNNIPERQSAKKEFISMWGPLRGVYWYGISISDSDEQDHIGAIKSKLILDNKKKLKPTQNTCGLESSVSSQNIVMTIDGTKV